MIEERGRVIVNRLDMKYQIDEQISSKEELSFTIPMAMASRRYYSSSINYDITLSGLDFL